MEKLIIPRSKWSGSKEFVKELYSLCSPHTVNGIQCCLGHYLNNKIDWAVFLDRITMPGRIIGEERKNVPSWLLSSIDDDSKVAKQLARINDDVNCDQDVKEATIAYVFEQYDVDVTFVN